MRYGLSMKWHNSCNRQTVVALYFLRAPKIHTLKKASFFVRLHADICPITRGYLSDYTRIKGVFFVMIYDWKGGIGI